MGNQLGRTLPHERDSNYKHLKDLVRVALTLYSIGAPSDFEDKVKWRARIVMGANVAAIIAQLPSTLSLLEYFNWTTVALVCGGP